MTNNNRRRCTDCSRVLTSSNRVKHSMGYDDICNDCYEIAGIENDHQDGRHETDDEGPHADCPMCGNEIADRSKPSNVVKAHTSRSHADCYAINAHEATKAGRAACRANKTL